MVKMADKGWAILFLTVEGVGQLTKKINVQE